MNQEHGWANVVLGDSEDSPSGWVKESFLAIDPAWYETEDSTPVYAWNDTSAPTVALLGAGTTLPILRDDGDWIVVSLRGAAGWIYQP
jgi:SH3-like domain-containing protein